MPHALLKSVQRLTLLTAAAAGEANASSYSDETARQISLYASAAYCSPGRVRKWQLDNGCGQISSFKVEHTWAVSRHFLGRKMNAGFAFVGVDHERKWVVAAFKGTNDTMDWVSDLSGLEFDFDVCKLPTGPTAGTVHNGFCAYYVSIARLGIGGNFTKLTNQYPHYTPVVTGHSLGGAAAALMAYDVYQISGGSVLPVLYTYGLPRVGDYRFAQALGKRTSQAFRVVHNRDIVPHLPLCIGLSQCSKAPTLPYHSATEVLYRNDMRPGASFQVCDGSGEDPSCSNGQIDLSAADHCSYFGMENCAVCCPDEVRGVHRPQPPGGVPPAS